jgi:hypothetical protein
MQGNQEKRKYQDYLRKSKTQTAPGLKRRFWQTSRDKSAALFIMCGCQQEPPADS